MAKSSLKTADKRVNNVDVKKYNVLGADSDNNYYGRMEDLLNSSNTATTCLRTFVRFVTGEGATNKDFGSSIVNRKGLTVDGLIRRMAESTGKFTGIALHVNYNGLGEKISVSPVEFSYCRKGIEEEEGKIAVYDNWDYSKSKQIKKDDIVFYDSYAPHKVLHQVNSIQLSDEELKTLNETEQKIRKWKKYGGQILWWTPNGEYPLVPFDSVAEDMQTEGNVKNTKRTASASNFMPSHIMERPAFEDSDEGDDERTEWRENLESFQGDDGVGSILELEVDSPESGIKLHKVDIQNYDGIQKFTEESVKENIRENRQIPAALLTDKSVSLSGEQIANAKEYYNDITSDDRKLISQLLEKVFKDFHKDINLDGDYSIKPLKFNREITEEYFPFYSKSEIRASKGDSTPNEREAEETPLSVELGVGSTQALIDLVANTELSDEQKIGSMKIVFGLTEAQSLEMLGKTKNTL
jgi:hypothetical protein